MNITTYDQAQSPLRKNRKVKNQKFTYLNYEFLPGSLSIFIFISLYFGLDSRYSLLFPSQVIKNKKKKERNFLSIFKEDEREKKYYLDQTNERGSSKADQRC